MVATKKAKTYNSGDSPVVTHLTTSPPVHCLSTAERTGSSIFSVLWSYVKVGDLCQPIMEYMLARWLKPLTNLVFQAVASTYSLLLISILGFHRRISMNHY